MEIWLDNFKVILTYDKPIKLRIKRFNYYYILTKIKNKKAIQKLFEDEKNIEFNKKQIILYNDFFINYIKDNIFLFIKDIEEVCNKYGENFSQFQHKIKSLSNNELITLWKFFYYSDNDTTKLEILKSNENLPIISEDFFMEYDKINYYIIEN